MNNADPFDVIHSDARSGAPAVIQKVGISNIGELKRKKKKMQDKKLSEVSDEKLGNMIDALRTELSRARSAKAAIEIKKRISLLEGEKVKREAVNIEMLQVEGPATAPEVVEKANDYGANMALGALLMGVVGYLGSGFAGKNQWTYGIGGAVVGAVGAYFLMKIDTMQDKKEASASSTTQPAKA